MSSSVTAMSSLPQFKGYRIRQQLPNELQQQKVQQTLIKIIVKNQTNGIPKVRHDIICNGKHYPFIPLFSFTSEDDLGIVDQISTIVLRDQNEILCEILSKKVTEIRISQFRELKQRFKSIFALQLKVDPEELFLLLISDDISGDQQFNDVFDSISETQFVSVIKRVYENCTARVIPKILRRISKYFNSTKGRQANSIQRLKRILKVIKSSEQGAQVQQKQYEQSPKKSQKQIQEKRQRIPQNEKQSALSAKVQQKPPRKKTQQSVSDIKSNDQSMKVVQKVAETQRIKTTQKVTKKQKVRKLSKTNIPPKQQQAIEQNEQDWHDVSQASSDGDDSDIQQAIGKMAFNDEEGSDEDFKYQAPKKKGKKKANITIPLDPEFESGLGRKPQRLKKQKKNQQAASPTYSGTNQSTSSRQPQFEQQKVLQKDRVYQKIDDKKNKRQTKGRNDQSLQNKKQFMKEKRADPRILLGINGASDQAWRQRMRPQRYPQSQNTYRHSPNKGQFQYDKENRGTSISKKSQFREDDSTVKQAKPSVIQEPTRSSKNLTLQKVYSIPEDKLSGKKFKFQKRNYNLFVNKLFWVNITQNQVTIQKDGKGYMRKCSIQVIDNGNGIMAEGLTLQIDGLSNLQDGGTTFGDPVFQQFTPEGQWFHIKDLDVFTYV